MQIESLLLNKYQQHKLHNLYLITPSRVDNEEYLLSWSENLLNNFLKHTNQTQSARNHEDILFLTASPEHKNYIMEDIDQVQNFLNYRAHALKNKFIVIEKAHLLTETHINKLLKTFEEPEVDCCFIVLNPQKTSLLPTLMSRSIQLRLAVNKSEKNLEELYERLAHLNYHDYLQYIQEHQIEFSTLMAIIWERAHHKKFTNDEFTTLKVNIELFDQMQQYNSSFNSKAYIIYYCLTQVK